MVKQELIDLHKTEIMSLQQMVLPNIMLKYNKVLSKMGKW